MITQILGVWNLYIFWINGWSVLRINWSYEIRFKNDTLGSYNELNGPRKMLSGYVVLRIYQVGIFEGSWYMYALQFSSQPLV